MHLQANAPANDPAWRVFDRSLIAKVLEDHHLPNRLAKFLREDAGSAVDEVLDELFGLHPPSWVLVQQFTGTILELAEAGNVILVGWGANIVTRKLPNVFHVRLTGSLERRVARVQQRERLGRKDALALITRQDRGRERYVKRHFDHQLSDALLYHLTINTDRFLDEEVAALICGTALSRKRTALAGGLALIPSGPYAPGTCSRLPK